jgi:DNA-binding response OmpR family regulator
VKEVIMEKILIIDDFEPFLSTACRVVERLGFQALSAADGREGLDVFARERPGIVITDLQMPLVDGTGVLLAIKEKSPQTAVVVLTGFSTEAAEQDLLRLGAFACLKKPLNLQQVVQVITQIQEKRRGVSNDVRPRALLKVDSPASRHVLERALHTNGCDTHSPETPEEWRVSLERGDLDILVWEVHAQDGDSLRQVMETRPVRTGFEVILLMTESGPAETVAREILQSAPTECLSAPLDDALVAASFQRAFHRLLVRRNALFKRERMNVGSARVSVGDRGELVVDVRGGDSGFLASIETLSTRLPWPWLLLGPSWEVVYASPALVSWVGRPLTRLDMALWEVLEGRGLVLPPLEEVYPALAQCARGETLPGIPCPEAVGMVAVKIMPSNPGSDRLVALFFPSSPPQKQLPPSPNSL